MCCLPLNSGIVSSESGTTSEDAVDGFVCWFARQQVEFGVFDNVGDVFDGRAQQMMKLRHHHHFLNPPVSKHNDGQSVNVP